MWHYPNKDASTEHFSQTAMGKSHGLGTAGNIALIWIASLDRMAANNQGNPAEGRAVDPADNRARPDPTKRTAMCMNLSATGSKNPRNHSTLYAAIAP